MRLFGPKFPDCVRIRSPRETLEKISAVIAARIPGAYFRFGDGEVNVLFGIGADEQGGNAKLAREMEEAMGLGGEGIVKSLVIHSRRYGMSEGMQAGFHLSSDELATTLLNCCFQYFIGNPIYSPVALAYALVKDRSLALDFFRRLKNVGRVVFVGNENMDAKLLRRLYGEDCLHIRTAPRDAYMQADEIERQIGRELAKRSEYTVVVFAAGPSTKILQKRLYNVSSGIFTFDVGSVMDALSGEDTRAWIDLAGVTHDYYSRFIEEL